MAKNDFRAVSDAQNNLELDDTHILTKKIDLMELELELEYPPLKLLILKR